MSNKIRVLLADDESQYGVSIRDGLEDADFDVVWVKNVSDAEKQLPEVDVLIMDVLIPEIGSPEPNIQPLPQDNGIKAVARIIKQGRLPPEVPIIFISAYIDLPQRMVEHSIPEDRCVYLQKDFVIDVLIALIRKELENRPSNKLKIKKGAGSGP